MGNQGSTISKYMALTIGSTSIFTLIKYECITTFAGLVPGALGLALRQILYPSLFKKCGKKVIFGRGLTIRNAQNITIGDNVVIDDYSVIDGRGAGEKGISIGNESIIGRNVTIISKIGSITIGDHVNVGTLSIITSQGGVTIEDWVQIAGSVKISGGLFTMSDTEVEGYALKRETKGPITIGEQTYLGSGVTVIDAVNVGKNCQIGAGSILISDIADHSVFVPRPGMIISSTKKSDL